MKYNRNLGSKRDQGLATPKNNGSKWSYFSSKNYKVLRNIWRNNVRGVYKWSGLNIPVLRNMVESGMLNLTLKK